MLDREVDLHDAVSLNRELAHGPAAICSRPSDRLLRGRSGDQFDS